MVSGCNTFKGMGKDVEGAGKAIQKGADKTKDAITK
ncbi:MAG: entericidin A/B family lipoprotein [Deltaproteobacteria bacterium]|nr:entericidin A/B family lipoprotein [Deltaproteobacteria bacterium]